MRTYHELVMGIRDRIARGLAVEARVRGQPRPPASPEYLDAAEATLGFSLPPLLRQLYRDVANGGFGPGYGLLGVPPDGATDDQGLDLVALYQRYREADPDDPHWAWPDRLLPMAHLGCAMYACVDTRRLTAPIVWFEPNPHTDGTPWDKSFIPLVDSLHGWLEAWLDGRDLIMKLVERQDAQNGKDDI